VTRRVIFLDVDGVLNHAEAFRLWEDRFGRDVLDHGCVRRLVELARDTGAEVVISSTWRLMEDAHRIISVALWTHGIELVGQTPDLWSTDRADEIRAWLADNPDVSRYVVLDDDPTAAIEGHTVLTDWNGGGLTDERAAEARRILEATP
jgi:hypothetical protein